MAAVRAIDTDDEYAFFNAVHLHRDRARSLHITDAAPRPPGPPATRCPGMELPLGTLNSFAHWEEPATLLAPAGSGGDALIRHWAELVRRSQTQATRWRVLLDGAPILDVAGAQLVRLAYPYSFVPVPTENLVYCDGMDRAFANTLLAARDRDLARQRGEASTPGHAGLRERPHRGPHGARGSRAFRAREQDGRTRRHDSSREGTLFASWLFATEGVAATTFENRVAFAETMKDFGMTAPVIVAGIENAVAATVILARPDALFLAPEFMLLGERWFPNWRTDHRAAFRLPVRSVCHARRARQDRRYERGHRLLDWAIRLEDWKTASLICVASAGGTANTAGSKT